MKTTILLFITITFTGCTTPNWDWQWKKVGGTEAAFEADMATCEYDAVKYAGGNSDVPLWVREKHIREACMKQKGWREVKVIHPSNAGVTVPSAPIPNRQDIPF